MNATTKTRTRWTMLSGRSIASAALATTLLVLPGEACADETGTAPQAQIGNPGRAAIEQKLKAIVIPEVKFDDTAFEEAVDALRTASQENDSSTSGDKGVRLWIQGRAGVEFPRVSMKLTKVSLGEALAKLNALSNTELKISGADVAIVPKGSAAHEEPAPEAIEAAKRTVIDLVDIENESLDSVVKFLNEKSAEKKGPKIAIGDGLDPKTNVGAIRLRNAALSDAVFFIARDINCKVTAADGMVRFVAR